MNLIHCCNCLAKRRGTKDTRERALPSHFVMSQARTVLHVTLFASRFSCVMRDVCSAATSRRLKFQSLTFPVRVGTVEDWDSKVFLVSSMPPASAPCCKCLAARFPPTTGSNHWMTTNIGRRVNHNIDNSAMSWLPQLWRRGCNLMCVLALLWLDEVSR